MLVALMNWCNNISLHYCFNNPSNTVRHSVYDLNNLHCKMNWFKLITMSFFCSRNRWYREFHVSRADTCYMLYAICFGGLCHEATANAVVVLNIVVQNMITTCINTWQLKFAYACSKRMYSLFHIKMHTVSMTGRKKNILSSIKLKN